MATVKGKYDFDYTRIELIGPSFGQLVHTDEPWVRHEFKIVVPVDVMRDESVEAGRMTIYKLNYSVMSIWGLSLWTAFDDFSDETARCYDVVFDEKEEIRKPFWHEYYGQEGYLCNDFHFLSRIEIDEEFKGHDLAGIATRIYFENFANGNDVAYLKAFPLQHEATNDDKPYKRTFKGSEKACFEKLSKYYEKLGFRRIGKTNHFFFVVDDFLRKNGSV